jgi:hypothetical protein
MAEISDATGPGEKEKVVRSEVNHRTIEIVKSLIRGQLASFFFFFFTQPTLSSS